MKIRKLLASACTALLIGLGLSLVATSSASAHTGEVTGVANCEADGTYTVTWTFNSTNTPATTEAEVKAMTTSAGQLAVLDGVNKGGQIFLSVWDEHQINVPGAPVNKGDWSAQFKTVGIPGTATEVTTMVQYDYKGGPSGDPVGKVTLDGKCTPPPTDTPVTPPAPVWVDECGPGNGHWTYTDTDQYSYNALPTGEITVSPKPGFVFPEGTTTWWQETDSNELCPPGPANPKALIEATCGAATVTLTNPGENILTASYVVNVDGKFYGAYSAEAGKTEVVKLTFSEDTGTHTVEVFQAGTSEWKSIGKANVASDCLPPVVPPTEEPPTEEPPTEQPPAEEPPATTPPTETPAPPVTSQVPPTNTQVLAATGSGLNTVAWLTGGSLLVALGALAVVLGLRRRQVRNEG